MEESPEATEDLTGKIHELLTESDDETGQFSFEEEMIEEVMQELYKEIVTKSASPPPPPSSSSSNSPMSSISPLLMDYGKNGSCGASVSDSASTVMAGIDVVSSGKEEMEKGSWDLDDEWLGRVLSWEQGQVVESRPWF